MATRAEPRAPACAPGGSLSQCPPPHPGEGSESAFPWKMTPHVARNDPSDSIRVVRRVTWIGMLGNILLAALKFVVGVVGSSEAVVADAVHSLSDLTTDAAILFGSRYWSAPPDREHPYGHGRIETIVTLGIGAVLGAVAVGIVYRALIEVREADIAAPGWIAFAGAVVSIFGKELLYRWTWRVGHRERSSALMANAWHHRSDALSSIPVAVTVLVAMIHPAWSFVDRIGAVIVGVFILQAAWRIATPAFHELTDRGAPAEVGEKIEAVARGVDGVLSVHAVRTRNIGPGVLVDLHVQVPEDLTVREGHDISMTVKERLLAEGPDVIDAIVHLEPFEASPGREDDPS